MTRTICLLALCLVGAAEPAKKPVRKPLVASQLTWVVKVGDRTVAADALIAKTEQLGGYFCERDDNHVTLKVPVAKVEELTTFIRPLGVVVQRTLETQDLTESLEEQRTRLASRQGVLNRYFSVINGAGPQAVVTVEREMTRLVQEIEELRGSIQLAEHQLALAQVDVRFEFKERQPPARDGSSSFAWLNTMNLVDVVGDFAGEN